MSRRPEALGISRELEEDKRPCLFGNPTYWRARIAALLGEKETAVNLLRQATKQGYAYSSRHPNEDFESLADYPLCKDQLFFELQNWGVATGQRGFGRYLYTEVQLDINS